MKEWIIKRRNLFYWKVYEYLLIYSLDLIKKYKEENDNLNKNNNKDATSFVDFIKRKVYQLKLW